MPAKKATKSLAHPTDRLLFGVISDTLRIVLIDSTRTIKTLVARHSLDPLTTLALGRAITCVGLMGSNLKEDDLFLKCQYNGQGALKQINAEFIAPATLRGFTIPDQITQTVAVDQIPASVGEALGEGTLIVSRGSRQGGTPYSSVCKLHSGEIAQEVAHYFAMSEQLPSLVTAGVHLCERTGQVLGAGGILVQKLGGKALDQDLFEQFELRIAQGLHISKQLANGETLEKLFYLLSDIPAEKAELTSKAVGFNCFCDRQRMAMALMSLGKTELKKIKLETRKIETKCHYCAAVYSFSLKELIGESK